MKCYWLWWRRVDVETERRQASEEGRQLSPLAGEFDALVAGGGEEDQAFQDRFNALLDKTASLPIGADYRYDEPSDLEGIRRRRSEGPRDLTDGLDKAALANRIHGAWLGRCVGCLLGKPIEGWRSPKLWGLLRDAGKDSLTDYLWRMGIPQALFEKHGKLRLPSPPEELAWMPEDDDTNYTLTGLAVMKLRGLDFTPAHVAEFWLRQIPILRTCTAERVAYRNSVLGIEPPASASVRNPYREWIGAQIRADAFGYIAAGRPQLAAELAWRDACISHIRNGIYGEMWVAAMLAAAAVEGDLRRVIEIGLSEIPRRCRLAEAIRDVLAWRGDGLGYAQAVERIHKRWDERVPHHWCHTISNAQVVAVGLLWGEDDFEASITRAVYPCFDTDCNGATVGSILGMVLGARALPEKWTGIMHDRILSGVAGYNDTSISATAAEMTRLCLKSLGS